VGCSESDGRGPVEVEPVGTWIRLAEGTPETGRHSPEELSFQVGPSGAERTYDVVELDGTTWLRTVVRRDEWTPKAVPGGVLWSAPVPIRGAGRPTTGAWPQRLYSTGRTFKFNGPKNDLVSADLRVDGFHARTSGVGLMLAQGDEPSEVTTLEVYAHRGGLEGERMRVSGQRFSGDGFALWPGEGIERLVDLPPDSTLRFTACIEPVVQSSGGGGRTRPVRLRVFLDGEALVERAFESGFPGQRHVVVPLPAEGRNGAKLRFEVRGALAYASFLVPVIGPSELKPSGPNIVVFLADTFRADNLAAYGGPPELTPYINSLAEESRLFARSWSAGTYTLPSHFAMFTGVHPRQAGARSWQSALPGAWVTIAEHLSAHGYRTGAVTESVFVSRDYSMDQGFEWWDESLEPFEDSLNRIRAFLDADDGRPTFLFVQTYRTHTPYRVSPETRERLRINGEWIALESARAALPADARDDPRFRAAVEGIEALYRGAAADLDQGFQTFHEELLGRGFDRNGYLIFTSDHGEAFFEHDSIYHSGRVYEELVRVPLFLSGPGIKPGVEKDAASLIDLAPTVADMARVPLRDEWLGRSLLTRGKDRPVFLFECKPKESTLAVIDGTRKIIDYESSFQAAETPFGAFDLKKDPGELQNLNGSGWPQKSLVRFRPDLERYIETLVTPADVALDAAKLEELKAMGYTGD
jgi:arylsulfatase